VITTQDVANTGYCVIAQLKDQTIQIPGAIMKNYAISDLQSITKSGNI
jgi:hypothetical protein